ncbi:HAMP domain-containing histidine kinase [candidate division KSB1 bacterium]|nr:HAMP domain-containing histidine kinase [candidate division KSB1 bacterium]NIR72570.1 HAMP domain-containing histidine kinase [candidate division KSB1 bacterium]NIS27322.1 HAMP domain-containing histidine kinase [candidate division KSB1 bacterium]NIT73532.1 HAMP domain-containing histidine kinase [candidate division KSB1 bacterium]NIU28052.1 HAMP domain-containing histidine kinase [candidate division KSB1 bacterium]
MKKRTFKLLTKTTSVYLVFTFFAFFGSALFLTHETDEFIHSNLAHRFRKSESRIRYYVKAGKPLAGLPYRVTRLQGPAPPNAFPIYSDTLIYNSELDEKLRYRKKASLIEVGGQFYKAEMVKSMEDFLRLRDDIFGALIPAFGLLAVGIALFNYFLSGYLFKSFNRILELMKTYKVGQKTEIEKVRTSTLEFQRMQELFHRMIDRIEYDYRHLKEYTENMAHEIQTPLAVIRNKTENIISDDSVMKRHADTIKIIYDEATHLSKLGNTLNLLTKIENGEFNDAVQISTRPVIEQHVAAVTELANLKSVEVETSLSDKHQMLIDPHLLDVMLRNLLRNAISYGTPDGPIHIKTDSEHLEVSNYGPALEFPPEQLFERFQHNQHRQSSLGLGLSLVKKICDLNNLKIDYRYDENQHIFVVSRH